MGEQYIRKIEKWLAITGYVWHQLSWLYIVVSILVFIALLSMVYGLIISPLIFRFYIIPRIEKKVGYKLIYHPYVGFMPFAARSIEVSSYIIKIYRDYKKTGYRGVPDYYNSYSLKRVWYTVDKLSKAEVFFSYALKINLRICSVALFTSVILSILHQNHYI